MIRWRLASHVPGFSELGGVTILSLGHLLMDIFPTSTDSQTSSCILISRIHLIIVLERFLSASVHGWVGSFNQRRPRWLNKAVLLPTFQVKPSVWQTSGSKNAKASMLSARSESRSAISSYRVGLDIGNPGSEVPFLVETATLSDEKCRYATLSHRWGDPDNIVQTTVANILENYELNACVLSPRRSWMR